jgi:hypothetical protein
MRAPSPQARTASVMGDIASKSAQSSRSDPALERLRSAKMTKTIVKRQPAAAVPVKPPSPDLSNLIRVRAILDFGDPKENEVVIEVIRTGNSKSYRVGESIADINASIMQIDKSVTFQYEGRTLQLDVRNGDKSDNVPIGGTDTRGAVAGQK